MIVWTADRVVAELRKRGELWESASGLVNLRGDALALVRRLERLFALIAAEGGFDEWSLAPGLPMETLARAQYFESFPQWLTAAGHLSDDAVALEAVARSDDPARAAAGAMGPSELALPPALCYQTYDALAGTTVETVRMTAHGACWRWEGDGLRTLERGWAFTMREMVHVGSSADVKSFRAQMAERTERLARSLGLESETVAATDPFFAPTARGRALLQQVKGLKTELRLNLGGGNSVAAASFNDHERFFGERFDIHLADGEPASSGCAAFGVERWALAFMVAHGPDAGAWPGIETEESQE